MDEKERIAKAALAELPADGAILLDAGSTTYQLAEALPRDRELTVVTNSVAIASMLTSWPNLELMLVGGLLRHGTSAAVGPWSLHALRDTFVDVAFLGADGVSTTAGLTTSDEAVASFKRAVVGSSRRVVLLADHTKLGREGPARFAGLLDIDTVITDSGVDPATLRAIADAGPQVVAA